MGYMLLPLKRYADFNGRSRRKEFWSWVLLNAIVVGVLMGILIAVVASAAARSTISYTSTGSSYRANLDAFQFFRNLSGFALVPFALLVIWSLVTFMPGLAVAIRRLHDSNKSGWFYLINFVPFVGPFIFLVFCFMEGTPGANQYGPDPKNPYAPIGGGGYGGYPPQPYGGPPPGQPYGGAPGQPYGAPPPPYGGHPGQPPYGGPQGGPPYGGGPHGGGYG